MASDLYYCFSCDAINRASQNRRCCCVGTENTLVCERCGRCFCDAPTNWKKNVWQSIGEGSAKENYQRPLILIIDDDRVIHSVVARVLEDFRGSVLHAYDGVEGLRIAQEVKPDLVITDCLLPLLDGREIARSLKSCPSTSHVCIVAISGMYRGARYRHEALRDFAVDRFVEKPISAAQLRSIIDDIVHLRPVKDTRPMQSGVRP